MYWVCTLFTYAAHGIDLITDKAKRTQNVSNDTVCSFSSEQQAIHESPVTDTFIAGPAIGLTDEESTNIIETTSSPEILKLWPWVNQVSSFSCSPTRNGANDFAVTLDPVDRVPPTASRDSHAVIQTYGSSSDPC